QEIAAGDQIDAHRGQPVLGQGVHRSVGGRPFLVTASIGLAQWRPGEDDLAGLLRRADHAMYVAKRAGRNRVFDGEELDPPALA
ncbi:hypothetical protein BMR86_11910, partial [Stenotrophomonas sp. KAs 5-3]